MTSDNLFKIVCKKHCTILATTILIFSVSACSNMQSPGGSRYNTKKYNKSNISKIESVKKENKSNKIKKNNEIANSSENKSSVSEIENFINKIETSKNTTNEPKVKEIKAGKSNTNENAYNERNSAKETVEGRLPTIREQMQNLANDQESIKNDVRTLQDDINEIKNSLYQIKNAIALNNSDPNQYADKGDGIKEKNITTKKIDNSFSANDSEFESNLGNSNSKDDDEDYVIESDEKVAKKNIQEEKKQTITSKNIPNSKKKITPKKVAKNSIYSNPPATTQNNFKATNQVQAPIADTKSFSGKSESSVDNALNSFKRKDYQTTINELNKVMSSQTDAQTSAICNYWIGESYFRMGNYSNAVKFFENTLSTAVNTKKEEAKIMIAECQLSLGKSKDAKSTFQQFVNAYPKSRYLPRAKKLLQQL